ncbi:MAG: hypothetical protein ACR2HR_06830 [Euzebya sp.]
MLLTSTPTGFDQRLELGADRALTVDDERGVADKDVGALGRDPNLCRAIGIAARLDADGQLRADRGW